MNRVTQLHGVGIRSPTRRESPALQAAMAGCWPFSGVWSAKVTAARHAVQTRRWSG